MKLKQCSKGAGENNQWRSGEEEHFMHREQHFVQRYRGRKRHIKEGKEQGSEKGSDVVREGASEQPFHKWGN